MEIINENIAIIGSGNIGSAIAKGFILSSMIKPEQITLTRRKTKLLISFEKKGCVVLKNNCEAVKKSKIIIIAVPPQQAKELLQEINSKLNPKKHIIISIISEEQMIPATALGACGIAFFLRAIRSASQGGIEIGFHSYEAIPMAAQTAKGAASLILNIDNHPEMEIDKVTTPEGCTIAGLNEMEHKGFSSAMIKGITTSADKATKLYKNNK